MKTKKEMADFIKSKEPRNSIGTTYIIFHKEIVKREYDRIKKLVNNTQQPMKKLFKQLTT